MVSGDLLARVNWSGVVRELVDTATGGAALDALIAATGSTFRQEAPTCPVTLLASLARVVPGRRPSLLHDAIAVCSDLESFDASMVAVWVASTSVAWLRISGEPDDELDVDPQPVNWSPGRLVLDPTFDPLELPLLDLAADLAATRANGLCVVNLPAGRTIDGYYVHATSTIVLDLGKLTDHHAITSAWAHELAHALDPLLSDRQPDEQEAFAEQLAPELLRTLPASLAAARPLIDTASTTSRRPFTPPGLPTDPLESLVAFRFLFTPTTAHRAGNERNNPCPSPTPKPTPSADGTPSPISSADPNLKPSAS